jgi:hypothetical protein
VLVSPARWNSDAAELTWAITTFHPAALPGGKQAAVAKLWRLE